MVERFLNLSVNALFHSVWGSHSGRVPSASLLEKGAYGCAFAVAAFTGSTAGATFLADLPTLPQQHQENAQVTESVIHQDRCNQTFALHTA